MRLSEFEIEVMRFFWDKGEGSVPEVHQWVLEDRKVAYSTVKTIVDRLEKKGAIVREKSLGRSIHYRSNVQEETLSRPLFKKFFSHVLGRKPKQLMNYLFEEKDLSLEDLAYLEGLIEKEKGKRHG